MVYRVNISNLLIMLYPDSNVCYAELYNILQELPFIQMSPVDTQGSDEELHHDTQRSLSCLAQSYAPPDQLLVVVDTVNEVFLWQPTF